MRFYIRDRVRCDTRNGYFYPWDLRHSGITLWDVPFRLEAVLEFWK